MICQKCHINPASVRVTQIIDNERRDLLLCSECARELGLEHPFYEMPDEVAGIIFKFLEEQMESQAQIPDITCGNCGLDIHNFNNNGLLGCPQCYEYFDDYLKTILRRYHGSNRRHKLQKRFQPRTRKTRKISILEKKLEVALQREDFESAAELRDEIKALRI